MSSCLLYRTSLLSNVTAPALLPNIELARHVALGRHWATKAIVDGATGIEALPDVVAGRRRCSESEGCDNRRHRHCGCVGRWRRGILICGVGWLRAHNRNRHKQVGLAAACD